MNQAYQAPNLTVLCIDDDEGILRYQRELLEKSGYFVLTASSAQQGLKLAAAHTCDAVLVDYLMPGMCGDQVACEIKRIKPELTVILMSASAVPMQALALADAFVPKLEVSQQLVPMLAGLLQPTPAQERERSA